MSSSGAEPVPESIRYRDPVGFIINVAIKKIVFYPLSLRERVRVRGC